MNSYWWFRPSRIGLVVIMPLVVCAYVLPNTVYNRFGASNALTDERFFLVWLSALCFSGASWIGEVTAVGQSRAATMTVPGATYRKVLYVISTIAIVAIAIFLAPFALHPNVFVQVMTAEPGAAEIARESVNQISGITSQENLACLAVVLFALKRTMTGSRLTRIEKAVFGVIIVLMVLKVFLHGERLALIELIVPLVIVTAGIRRRSVLWTIAPVAGVLLLVAFFTGTEYLRSWVAYYAERSDGLVEFALNRIAGYYVTAVNNGAYLYAEQHSLFFPVQTAGWMWRLPIPGLVDYLTDMTGAQNDLALLRAGQNIEFNNISGLFGPLIDFGPVLGILVWMSLGFISGRLYRSFISMRYIGLILFPTWYIGVLEMARIFYWGDNRYLPPLVASCYVAALFSHLASSSTSIRSMPQQFVHSSARPSVRQPAWRGMSGQDLSL